MLDNDKHNGDSALYKVMVVDDSAVIRGLVKRMIGTSPVLETVASASNGEQALTELKRHDVDVIILDIEMPIMTGMEALPKLLEIDPDVQIIISSTLSTKNASISLQAMAQGAADYIAKPSSLVQADDFKDELIGKVEAFGKLRHRRKGRVAKPAGKSSSVVTKTSFHKETAPIKLLPIPSFHPDVIAIGSSTGGPQALFALFKGRLRDVKQPIVITQHMPATFTKILAGHITRIAGRDAFEAENGMKIVPGGIYIAPGDFHMTFEKKDSDVVVKLLQTPQENFCRPAVDPMFRSVAGLYGKKVLGIVLTGMGHDGAKGAADIVKIGGAIVAQDEESSVVWGMPGAVAVSGVCCAVIPIDEIAPFVYKFASG